MDFSLLCLFNDDILAAQHTERQREGMTVKNKVGGSRNEAFIVYLKGLPSICQADLSKTTKHFSSYSRPSEWESNSGRPKYNHYRNL